MHSEIVRQILAEGDRRREARRSFLRMAGGATAAVAGGAILSACGSDDNFPDPTPAPTASPTTAFNDVDILNFALNLEYLEAQFYSYAAFGTGLSANLLTGTGTAGAVRPGRAVQFTDPVVAAYAREIARDEIAHVTFLRSQLGTAAVAQPAIDVSAGTGSAFSNAAVAAGLPASFDPYASDENFLLGAFIFEDVGVTAYKGAVPLLGSRAVVEAAAGIHAAEAYHAGLIRTVLYRKGLTTASLISSTEAISSARDSLDGPSDIDQGITPSGTGASIKSNIVPTDTSGIAYSRSAGQVLNIVFLNRAATTSGGFFPAGVNGTIRTSAAN